MPTSKWLITILLLGFFFTLYVTFFPFDFFLKELPTIPEIIQTFDDEFVAYFSAKDVLRNVILFMPIGFGLAGILLKIGCNKVVVFFFTLFTGVLFSTGIEFLQIFSISRFPTFYDVLANSVGAGLGTIIFIRWGNMSYQSWLNLSHWLDNKLSFRSLFTAYMLFVFTLLSLTIYLQRQLSFNNWTTNFPLILGNEYTENRSWNGFLTDVYLFDEALGVEDLEILLSGKRPYSIQNRDLIASYNFTDNEASNFPAIEWVGTPALGRESEGALFSQGQWLVSEEGGRLISRHLRETNEFTVGLIGAPINIEQRGPARIVSISASFVQRNLTIGQSNNDLNLRIRTPFSDENGRYPEFVFPDVFVDNNLQYIIITYTGSSIHLFINNVDNHYVLEPLPAVLLFSLLHPTTIKQIRINPGNTIIFRLLYAALFLVPLAGLLVYKLRKNDNTARRNWFVLFSFTLLAPVVLEGILVLLLSRYAFAIHNLWIYMIMFLLAVAYIWWLTRPSPL